MIEILFTKPLTQEQSGELVYVLGTGNSVPIDYAHLIEQAGATIGCRVSPIEEDHIREWGKENGVLESEG
jgi:hypothetical protein